MINIQGQTAQVRAQSCASRGPFLRANAWAGRIRGWGFGGGLLGRYGRVSVAVIVPAVVRGFGGGMFRQGDRLVVYGCHGQKG